MTLRATPGVGNVYLGNIADGLFFNRDHVIDPAVDVGFGTVGSLGVVVTAPIIGTTLANVTSGIQLRSVALGAAPTASTEVFTAPFPQSQTVSTDATFLTNLANTLVTNLGIQVSGSLGALLDPLVNGTILPALRPIVTNAVTPLLAPVLGGVVQPALRQLGVGLGQLDLTVNAISAVAAPAANPDFATTPQKQPVAVPVLLNDAALPDQPLAVTAVIQPAPGRRRSTPTAPSPTPRRPAPSAPTRSPTWPPTGPARAPRPPWPPSPRGRSTPPPSTRPRPSTPSRSSMARPSPTSPPGGANDPPAPRRAGLNPPAGIRRGP